jgi:hypothetical protein
MASYGCMIQILEESLDLYHSLSRAVPHDVDPRLPSILANPPVLSVTLAYYLRPPLRPLSQAVPEERPSRR